MKLLFIENRYKTFFYEPITHLLEQDGHDVSWLVQNKDYTPKSKHLFVLPYPKKNNNYTPIASVEQVISVDRQQNHFQKKDQSYFYTYHENIKQVLEQYQPDVVFGECTAFHELLTINLCRDKGILYLNPSSCRYPTGRFSFYKYDTLQPYKGSGEILSNSKAEEIVNQIVYRTAKPDYMNKLSTKKPSELKDKLLKIKSYVKGERFNTPNPVVKYSIEKTKETNIKKWDALASNEVNNDTKFKVLYPLQMQPEANIDVWGNRRRNQTKLIFDLVNSLPEDAMLYVKPNPKSKYELSDELFNLVSNNSKISCLHHSTKMDDVLPKIDLVATVTGTVAIECVLSNKPVVTFVKTLNNQSKNCIFIETVDKIPDIITQIQNKAFYKNTLEDNITFINNLNKTSYTGKVTDPFSDPTCVNDANINNMYLAFNHVLLNSE